MTALSLHLNTAYFFIYHCGRWPKRIYPKSQTLPRVYSLVSVLLLVSTSYLFFVRFDDYRLHGPLTRYEKLQVAHAPGMPGTFPPPPRVSDPDMHHGTGVTHVPWCMPGSLTNGFHWSRWRGKHSRHSRRMHNPQLYVSGKRPMPLFVVWPHGSRNRHRCLTLGA